MRKHFTSGKCVRDENVKRKEECLRGSSRMSRKGEHGITLIALLITIIVILALFLFVFFILFIF